MTKRQSEIPGTEREVIEDLDEVIGEYVEALYEYKRLGDQLGTLKARVESRMQFNEREFYRYEDGEARFDVTYKTGDPKLKCKRTFLDEEQAAA